LAADGYLHELEKSSLVLTLKAVSDLKRTKMKITLTAKPWQA
jgi:hypothetical protein